SEGAFTRSGGVRAPQRLRHFIAGAHRRRKGEVPLLPGQNLRKCGQPGEGHSLYPYGSGRRLQGAAEAARGARIRQASRDRRIQGTDGHRAASVVKIALLAVVLALAAGCSGRQQLVPSRLVVLRFENLTGNSALDWMGRGAARQIGAQIQGAAVADSPQIAPEREA